MNDENNNENSQMEESYTETVKFGQIAKDSDVLVLRIGSEGSATDARYVDIIDKQDGIVLKNYLNGEKKVVSYDALVNDYTMRDMLDLLVGKVAEYQNIKSDLKSGSKSPDVYYPLRDVEEEFSIQFNTAHDRYQKLISNPKKSKMIVTDKPRAVGLSELVKDNLGLLTTVAPDEDGKLVKSQATILDIVIGVDTSGGDTFKVSYSTGSVYR